MDKGSSSPSSLSSLFKPCSSSSNISGLFPLHHFPLLLASPCCPRHALRCHCQVILLKTRYNPPLNESPNPILLSQTHRLDTPTHPPTYKTLILFLCSIKHKRPKIIDGDTLKNQRRAVKFFFLDKNWHV